MRLDVFVCTSVFICVLLGLYVVSSFITTTTYHHQLHNVYLLPYVT